MDSHSHSNPWVWRAALAACLLAVVLGGVADAQGTEPPWAAETGTTLGEIIAGHNAAVDDVDPTPATALVRDERVTLFVSDAAGRTAAYSFRTDATLHVTEFAAGTRDDATLHVFTDRATVDRIAAAPDRGAAFEAAVRAGDVRIEGVGPVNRALWGLVGLLLWALASPGRAALAGTVALVGVGTLAVAGTKFLGGGAVATGSGATGAASAGTGTTGTATTPSAAMTGASAEATSTGSLAAETGANTVTTGSSPLGIADRVLSFFERLLFIVAIAKKLGARLSRSLGGIGERLGRLVGRERLSDLDLSPDGEDADVPPVTRPRRRPAPRRRRR